MKYFKQVSKRSFAMLLVLVMSLGLLQTTAFAMDAPDSEASNTVVTDTGNADEFLDSNAFEVPDNEASNTVVTDTDNAGESFDSDAFEVPEDTFVPPAEEPETVPAEVQAFLDAVAVLPAPDAVNAVNAEAVGYQVNGALDMYEGLIDAGLDGTVGVAEALETVYAVYEAVLAAEEIEDSDTYLEQIPGYTPADRFYYNGREVAQLYVGTYANKPVYQYTNPATSIAVHVGETGSEQYLYTKSATCHCGNVLVEETPDWIAVDSNRKLTDSNSGIVDGKPTWSLAAYESEDWSDSLYEGYPALQIGVTGAKPGHTSLEFQTYQNYYYAYYWKTCRRCGQVYSEISFKGKWIEDTQTLNVTVNADYVLNYDANGGTPVPHPTRTTVANTSADLTVTSTQPTLEGYTFMGWADTVDATEAQYAANAPITLEWTEGFGSKDNPVTKTLYAVWEKDDEPIIPTTTYKVVREYYVNNEKIAMTISGEYNGSVGDEIVGKTLADENPGWKNYTVDGQTLTFEYKGSYEGAYVTGTNMPQVGDKADSITLTDNVKTNVIVLRYEKNTYTVIYTDGVEDEEVFADQSTPNLAEGDETPKFMVTDGDGEPVAGTPARDGYTFMGWKLTSVEPNKDDVQETVAAEDANANNDIIYTATWQKNEEPPTPTTYTVAYTWTGLPEGTTDPAVPDGDSYSVGAEVTVDTRPSGNEVTVDGVTYVFSGWSTDDATIDENGKFTMPAENVVITGNWTEKTPVPSTSYRVEWYNEKRQKIKEPETRYGIAGETATVTEDDKVVDGYVFAAKSTSNVLEKEIAADGTTVLKLFFTTESLKVTKTAAKRVERDENGKATACYVDYTVTLKSNLAKPQYFIQFQDVMEKGLTFVTDETGALANLSYTLRKANGQTYECEDFGSWLNGEDIEDPDSRLDKNNTVAYICFQLNAENGFFENGDALIVKYTAKADTPIAEVTQYHNHVYATTWNAN